MGHEVVRVAGGAIPRNWIPSVEKGLRSAMEKGIVAGFPVTGVRIDLYDGKFHDVDSSDISFQLALAFPESFTCTTATKGAAKGKGK